MFDINEMEDHDQTWIKSKLSDLFTIFLYNLYNSYSEFCFLFIKD